MEIIVKIFEWLKPKPIWAKIIAIAVVAAIAVLLLCSCGATSKLPDMSDYKAGAEGVVSKEKNVTKQTKWYFLPESQTPNTM